MRAVPDTDWLDVAERWERHTCNAARIAEQVATATAVVSATRQLKLAHLRVLQRQWCGGD